MLRWFVSLVCCALLCGCDRAPSAEGLPEWKPTDHDRLADQAAARGRAELPPAAPMPAGHPPTAASTTMNDAGARDAGSVGDAGGTTSPEALAEVAWASLCVTCHGPGGRGDGPQGPMVRPPDFTDKAWQASRTDTELATSIVNGKNKMPQFGLPERTVGALVQRVRGFAH